MGEWRVAVGKTVAVIYGPNRIPSFSRNWTKS
jgi:hypothetical protein